MKINSQVLFSYAFRPLFLVNGLFAVFVVFTWVLTLHGMGLPNITPLWHAHEMLMGFAMAAVAGFSLTAVANWTGRPAVHGTPLAWLVLTWLTGRLAMLSSSWLLPSVVLILDQLFPILLLLLLSREILGGRNRRNYPLVGILLIVVILNSVFHLGINQWLPGAMRLSIYLLIHTLVFLVSTIAGRIVPNFTANWLRQQNQLRFPVDHQLINRLALFLTIAVGLAAGLIPLHPLTGVLAFAAALLHGIRLIRWCGFATRSNPLLFVLHAAYAWIPVAYLLLGCSVFAWVFNPTAALHALTMGAIGSMILAITTRVALGHTGRPLQAAPATIVAYWIYMLAVVIRIFGPLTGIDYLLIINLSALGWILSFTIFSWVYWPILTRSRIDS